MTANGGTIDNAAGANILGDAVTLTSTRDIKNHDSAIIKGDSQVTMHAQGDVINTEKATITTPQLSMDGVNVSNSKGGKILANDIAIQAKDRFTSDSLASMKADKIAVDATHFDGANSEILATNDIDLKTVDYTNTANISSANTATLTIKNDGNLTLDQGHLAPQAEQLLTLNAHDVTTNTELNNPGSIHVNATGNVHNNKGIVTGKSLVVKATGAIENAVDQLVFAAQDITMEAGSSISNLKDALIMAMGNMSLTATEVKNDQGRITSGESMSIDADKITNQGAVSGGPVIAQYSPAAGSYEWDHDSRTTTVAVAMALPVYKSDLTVNQAVIESGGDLKINQGSKKGKHAQVTNADSLMTASGNIKVDGDLFNTSTEASKSIYELLRQPADIMVGAGDSLALAHPTSRGYSSLWDLLSDVYQSENQYHTIWGLYKYDDNQVSLALQTVNNPVFNQIMSAAFGADWRAQTRTEMSNRINNIRSSAAISYSSNKPSEIAAGGTFEQRGGEFHNGGVKKEQELVKVKVDSKTVSTIQGNFDRTFNNSVLFDDSKTPSFGDLTAAMNPQNIVDRLTRTSQLFTMQVSPPPLVLEWSEKAPSPIRSHKVSSAALGAEVSQVNTEIVTAPGAKLASADFTPIFPLYETRIAYIDQSKFFGSQYFFDKIGYRSDRTVPVIGDAFFENQLITQTIQGTVGGYFAARNGVSGAELVKWLMDNAATAQVELGLHLGVPLTEAQYAKLSSDIIWYEPVVINGASVLSPKVYLSKATLAEVAKNHGTTTLVASKGALSIDATKVSNVDGAVRGSSVAIKSAGDIVNQNTGGGTGGVFADSKVTMNAKGNVQNIGSTIAGKDVAIHADGSFTDSARMGYDEHGSLVLKDRGQINGGKDGSIAVDAAGDVNLTAAGMRAKNVSVKAGGKLDSNDVHEVSSSFQQSVETNGFDVGPVKIALGKTTKTDMEVSATSVGSQLQGGADGGSLTLLAGKDITLKGGDYSADKGLIKAGGKVKTETGQDFNYSEKTMRSEGLDVGVAIGIAGKGVSAHYGTQGASAQVVTGEQANNANSDAQDNGLSVLDAPISTNLGYKRVETKDTHLQVQNHNAQLNFGSEVTVKGEGTVDIGGADIQAVKDGKAGDLTISGSEVISTKYEDEDVQTHSNKEMVLGGRGSGSSSVVDTVNHSMTLVDKTKQGMTVDPGMTTLQAVGDATNLAFNDAANAAGKVGLKWSETNSSSRHVSENINTLKGNIKISSTKGDIKLAGVTLDGTGAGVELESAGNVSLTAARSASESQSSTLSHELSASINTAASPTGVGMGASWGYNGSLDESYTAGIAYKNAQVLGDKVSIKAKKDLALTGAKVTANDVDLDIAGNTRVTSVQDVSDMSHTVANWGANGGLSIATTSIITPTGGGNGGGGKDTDRSALTAEQSGITAKNKLNAKIGGDLSLTGAHLISESGQGKLDVAGKIHAEQLQDSRNKDGGSAGGGGGVSKAGLVTATVDFKRVDQVHYDATQNATIAGLQVNSGQGVEGTVNRDASKTQIVTRDEHIAGNEASITVIPQEMKKAGQKIADTFKTVKGAITPKSAKVDIASEPVTSKPAKADIASKPADTKPGKAGDIASEPANTKPAKADIASKPANTKPGKAGEIASKPANTKPGKAGEIASNPVKAKSPASVDVVDGPKSTTQPKNTGARVFDSVEFSQIKDVVKVANSHDKQVVSDLKRRPVTIQLSNGAEPVTISDVNDLKQLHGVLIDTGARAKGLNLPAHVGESTKVYVHIQDLGNGQYGAKYSHIAPKAPVTDSTPKPFKASPAPSAPAKASPAGGEAPRTTKAASVDTTGVKPPLATVDSQVKKNPMGL
ncbi:hemagglutinin repeat-containing protein [Pseudomonas sp. ITA]|uniref:hemagglutinin repeat-containing protein n=1 Tax=Pseudomonas sp. ITA TaxID=2825841 RepID=UPI0024961DB7|nr:hemagglutinin repeat-containing protein [Pseudomonas sp. ITA]MDI2146117.1 hemagglutinin repeat-containing protein [Pseudomonas sp. ITA]